jgi:MFS family permease
MSTSIRNIILLALCQALYSSSASLIVSSSAIVGKALAFDPRLTTLPISLLFLATMLTAFPASMLMKHIGRKYGFIIGAALGFAGAGICAFAISIDHFWLFAMGSVGLGSFAGFAQFYRFAAADVADEANKNRAISLVLSGGILGAFLGPNLAVWSRTLLNRPFHASYLVLLGVYVVTILFLSLARIPRVSEENFSQEPRPLRRIARQPAFLVAVLGATVGHGVMVLLMTATPLAMDVCNFTFANTAMVIQWHIVGMFAPSFFTGDLIKRFGNLNIMMVGGALQIACILVNIAGTQIHNFLPALIVLGMGWNFLFIGGTSLLTETYNASEKAKVQGANDLIVFTLVTVFALTSGALHSTLGWEKLNMFALPLILGTVSVTLWLKIRRSRRPAGGAVTPQLASDL